MQLLFYASPKKSRKVRVLYCVVVRAGRGQQPIAAPAFEDNRGAALQIGGGMTYCATCFLRLATSCSPIEEPFAPKRAVT